MKIIYKLIIAFVAISIFYVSLNFAASELGGEVVQLIRNDPESTLTSYTMTSEEKSMVLPIE